MDKSYFDKEELLRRTEEIKDKANTPEWLPEALRLLAENSQQFNEEEDPDRFVIEFIYPH